MVFIFVSFSDFRPFRFSILDRTILFIIFGVEQIVYEYFIFIFIKFSLEIWRKGN